MEPFRICKLDFLISSKAARAIMQVVSYSYCRRKKIASLLPQIIRELLDEGSPIARITVEGSPGVMSQYSFEH